MHIVLEDAFVRVRQIGRQQLVHGGTNDRIDVQFGIQSGTGVHHSRQAIEQHQEEGVDGLHLHVIEIEQHALEALSGTATQQCLIGFHIAYHKAPGVVQKIIRPTLRYLMQKMQDTFTHLRRCFVGKRDG